MDVSAALLPIWLKFAAALLWGAVVWRALQAAAAQRSHPSPHLLGAVAVSVALMWAMSVTPVPGFSVHLMGAALATWLLGAPLALLAVSAATVLNVGFGTLGWDAAPVQALLQGVLPVLVARGWLTLAERLPRANLFVYLLGVAFFGTAAAVTAGTAASVGLGSLLGATHPGLPWIALVPIAYAEAFITGALTTIFVLYRPQWVATFEDARWFGGRS